MPAQEILTAALQLFSKKGYDATTLADIANKIGIKKPSIYAHYASKMELFLSILHSVKADYLQCWRAALEHTADQPADERLKAIFFTVSDYFLQHRDDMYFWMRIWMFPPADCDADVLRCLQETNQELIETVAAIFRQGIDDKIFIAESPVELAHAYCCMMDGYLARVICYPEFDYNKTLAIVWNSFLLSPLQKQSV